MSAAALPHAAAAASLRKHYADCPDRFRRAALPPGGATNYVSGAFHLHPLAAGPEWRSAGAAQPRGHPPLPSPTLPATAPARISHLGKGRLLSATRLPAAAAACRHFVHSATFCCFACAGLLLRMGHVTRTSPPRPKAEGRRRDQGGSRRLNLARGHALKDCVAVGQKRALAHRALRRVPRGRAKPRRAAHPHSTQGHK